MSPRELLKAISPDVQRGSLQTTGVTVPLDDNEEEPNDRNCFHEDPEQVLIGRNAETHCQSRSIRRKGRIMVGTLVLAASVYTMTYHIGALRFRGETIERLIRGAQQAFIVAKSEQVHQMEIEARGYECENEANYIGEKTCFEPCPQEDVITIAACAELCDAHLGCAVFVMHGAGKCYLKSQTYLKDTTAHSMVSCKKKPEPCKLRRGDCASNDVHGQSRRVGGLADCRDACHDTVGCKFFVFWPKSRIGHNCFPKTKCDTNTGGDAIAYDMHSCPRDNSAPTESTTRGSPFSWLPPANTSLTSTSSPSIAQTQQAVVFSKNVGFISGGGSLLVATLTVSAAKKKCQQLPSCAGFTFGGSDTGDPLKIYFKNKWDVAGTHWGGKDWTSYRLVQNSTRGSDIVTEAANQTSTTTSTPANFLDPDLVFDANTARAQLWTQPSVHG